MYMYKVHAGNKVYFNVSANIFKLIQKLLQSYLLYTYIVMLTHALTTKN